MTKRNSTDYDENVGHLLGQTARAWRYALDARLQPLGLSQAQWMVLFHVSRATEALTQSELARHSGVEGPTMAGLLDRMERAGWIVRHVGKTDRRSKTVHLTSTAKGLSRRIERMAAELRTELLDGIPHDDIASCMTVLTHITDRARLLDSPVGTQAEKKEQS